MDDSECLAEFRFHKSDIPVLLDVLQLPQHLCADKEQCAMALKGFVLH